MLDPTLKMGAVTLKVRDLAKVADFYEQVIGLRVRERSATTAELGTESLPLVRLMQVDQGQFNRNGTGLYHLAVRVPTRHDLAHWLRQYVDKGNPYWQGASDHGVSEALYLSDPEGNGIEVYRDLPRDDWPRLQDGRADIVTERLDLNQLVSETPSRPWEGVPDGTDMGHVHLKVNDVRNAHRFYVDVFGFDEIMNFRDTALFVSAGGYHHHLGLNTWHSKGAPRRQAGEYGLAEYEIVVADSAERDRIVARLEAADYADLSLNDGVEVIDPAGILFKVNTD